MGEVYRADDLKLGQQVALKFLPRELVHPSAIERLHGEVRLGRKIFHPNVCRLYDISEWKGNHFVTMEYIDGEDLASLLRRIGRLPQEKAVELAQGICAGLAAAHGLGVVHCDLKPANIMIDGRGNAIITDFGLAALAEDLEGHRPRSIHSVIAALPGADPLQAAVDAGETPSPEMVAAAGKRGELSIGWAAGLTVAALAILVWVVSMKERSELYGVVPLPKHPRALEEDAREILERTGFESRARDSSYYLGLNTDYASAPGEAKERIGFSSAFIPPPTFSYRESPRELLSWKGTAGDRRILPNDPAHW